MSCKNGKRTADALTLRKMPALLFSSKRSSDQIQNLGKNLLPVGKDTRGASPEDTAQSCDDLD